MSRLTLAILCVAVAAASDEADDACALQLPGSTSSTPALAEVRPEMSLAENAGVDLLEITKITCVKPDGGLVPWAQAAFAAVATTVTDILIAIQAGVILVGSGGTAAPVTVKLLAVRAGVSGAAGVSAAYALSQLDETYKGKDQLIVKVNGAQVFPTGEWIAMVSQQTRKTSINVSFIGHARISLIEWDRASDNDDLGHADVASGPDAFVEDQVITAPHSDGSIYKLSYKRHQGKGNPLDVAGWVLCGTNQCDACIRPQCENQPYDKLDRDKDKVDLKRCPPGMGLQRYIKYPQWFFADVYLAVCKRHGV